jgi:enolase
VILAGDELFADSVANLRAALPNHLANAAVVTLGKVGTLTETLEYIKLAKRHNYKLIASQRNAETNDDFIADLAVAAGADYFKGGAPARGERVAKWNRLIKIENWLYGND